MHSKHAPYASAYEPFGYFWGLGVEHETYVKSAVRRSYKTVRDKLKPERYSVPYLKAYVPEDLQRALTAVEPLADVPVLLNSHSFTHCDYLGNHKTTYEKVPQPNVRYSGTTLFEWAGQKSAWLSDPVNLTFDGDTLEFITRRFYRATIRSVLEELQSLEEKFVAELNALPREGVLATYGPFTLAAPDNEPFATYATNPTQVAMFNNGTVHVNVTLPTRLNSVGRPLWPAKFLRQHQVLARVVQWVEPLWVAMYGSPDPLALRSPDPARFSRGSQRLAVARYVAVGTFDTETMVSGKVLQVPRTEGLYPWYDRVARQTAYAAAPLIGLDLNFNKHYAHGLELRFFDQLPLENLRVVLGQLAVLMDVALERGAEHTPNPTRSAVWQDMVVACLVSGPQWLVSPEQHTALYSALRIPPRVALGPTAVGDLLRELFVDLHARAGFCTASLGPV